MVHADTMIFLSGGEFQMGNAFAGGDGDEYPVHTVYVVVFLINTCQLTNQQ
jgi:formylglycine-generating enzyme required for sulfatase activity